MSIPMSINGEELAAPVARAGLGRRLRDAGTRFFLEPASPRPLAALRIGLGLTLMTQAYLCRTEVLRLFASDGLVQSALNQYFTATGVPTIGSLAPLLAGIGLGEPAVIMLFGAVYFLSLALMTLGCATRLGTILAWFCHWTFMNSASASNYGADLYAHVFLFYLMFAPAGAAWSLDALWGRVSLEPSAMARLTLRIMQLHLCITYLTSAIEKGAGVQWRNGELLWRAMQLPVYKQFDMSWLIDYPYLGVIGGWATLILEGGYWLFIWPRQTRRLWVLGIAGLHLGIAVFLGLGVFGCLMAVLTVSLFGVAATPRPVVSVAAQPVHAVAAGAV